MLADAQPTEGEREVWQQVDVVLKDAKAILDQLQAYKGAGRQIREVRLVHMTQIMSLRIQKCYDRLIVLRLNLFFFFPPGNPESRRRGASGAGVVGGGPLGREAQKVLRVLPEIRCVAIP